MHVAHCGPAGREITSRETATVAIDALLNDMDCQQNSIALQQTSREMLRRTGRKCYIERHHSSRYRMGGHIKFVRSKA